MIKVSYLVWTEQTSKSAGRWPSYHMPVGTYQITQLPTFAIKIDNALKNIPHGYSAAECQKVLPGGDRFVFADVSTVEGPDANGNFTAKIFLGKGLKNGEPVINRSSPCRWEKTFNNEEDAKSAVQKLADIVMSRPKPARIPIDF